MEVPRTFKVSCSLLEFHLFCKGWQFIWLFSSIPSIDCYTKTNRRKVIYCHQINVFCDFNIMSMSTEILWNAGVYWFVSFYFKMFVLFLKDYFFLSCVVTFNIHSVKLWVIMFLCDGLWRMMGGWFTNIVNLTKCLKGWHVTLPDKLFCFRVFVLTPKCRIFIKEAANIMF